LTAIFGLRRQATFFTGLHAHEYNSSRMRLTSGGEVTRHATGTRQGTESRNGATKKCGAAEAAPHFSCPDLAIRNCPKTFPDADPVTNRFQRTSLRYRVGRVQAPDPNGFNGFAAVYRSSARLGRAAPEGIALSSRSPGLHRRVSFITDKAEAPPVNPASRRIGIA